MIETVEHQEKALETLALAVSASLGTAAQLFQRPGFMRQQAGKTIVPHDHNPSGCEFGCNQKALLLMRGVLRVDFCEDDQACRYSPLPAARNVSPLVSGGHDVRVIEDIGMKALMRRETGGSQPTMRWLAVHGCEGMGV
ncbi:hypothetical protein [Azospirillum doebereinerae]|uniref:Uncharacterized protein n=1 Tax=Azospirillum doebereinerae TaxID=92933 RepID=A0A433J6S3_9PROT|nr:hypothetical protein [Azospirillum doebereinerae]MCG5238886.1 hypothetical protein [Azospirillum doebereinerae]RUQ68899.1 hypothetical protein EJ913_17150 [Azospirillum doebereinerae]